MSEGVKLIGDMVMLYRYKNIWVDSKHGENQESASPQRQFNDGYMAAKKQLLKFDLHNFSSLCMHVFIHQYRYVHAVASM